MKVAPGAEKVGDVCPKRRASLGAQLGKKLPAVRETWVRSLGWEEPRRRARRPTPAFWPGEARGQRSLAGYSPWGCRVRHDGAAKHSAGLREASAARPSRSGRGRALTHQRGGEGPAEKAAGAGPGAATAARWGQAEVGVRPKGAT